MPEESEDSDNVDFMDTDKDNLTALFAEAVSEDVWVLKKNLTVFI
jgi:hypothetical protein